MNKNEILKGYISHNPRMNKDEIKSAIDQLSENECSNILDDIEKQQKNGTLHFKITSLKIHEEKNLKYTVEFSTGYTFGGR